VLAQITVKVSGSLFEAKYVLLSWTKFWESVIDLLRWLQWKDVWPYECPTSAVLKGFLWKTFVWRMPCHMIWCSAFNLHWKGDW